MDDHEFIVQLSITLRGVAKMRHILIKDLEEKCGLAKGYIGRMVDTKGNTGFIIVYNLAKALDISMDTLIYLTEQKLFKINDHHKIYFDLEHYIELVEILNKKGAINNG